MFSDALLRALEHGDRRCGPYLSVHELGLLVVDNLQERFPSDWIRPQVHAPDQTEGDVTRLPIFPNPAYIQEALEREKQRVAEQARVEEEKRSVEQARVEEGKGKERSRGFWLAIIASILILLPIGIVS